MKPSRTYLYVDQATLRYAQEAAKRHDRRITTLWLICLAGISAFAFWHAYNAELAYQAHHSPAIEALQMQDTEHAIILP